MKDSSRYLLVEGVVFWDERQENGTRLYSLFANGRWQPYPTHDIMRIIHLGVEINQSEARERILASEVERTGCAFDGTVEYD